MFTLYKHTNTINGKAYIGFTSGTMEDRWQQHIRLSTKNNVRCIFSMALKKHGVDCWTHEIVETHDDLASAKLAEKRLIHQHRTHYIDGNGYNMTYGGDGTHGLKWNEKSKRRLRSSRLGTPSPTRKRVGQFDVNGTLVAVYESGSRAHVACNGKGRNTGGLLACCLGKRTSWRGFIWRYVSNDHEVNNGSNLTPDQLQSMQTASTVGPKKGCVPMNRRAVVGINDDNVVIARYQSLLEASRDMGFRSSANICACCLGHRKTAGGLRWRYDD